MDYKKTYVRVNSQKEQDKAFEFYRGKGFRISCETSFSTTSPYIRKQDNPCTFFSNFWEKGETTIDITEEVLGKKEPIPENTAVRITSEREFYLLMDAYEKRGWKRCNGKKPKEFKCLSIPNQIDLCDLFCQIRSCSDKGWNYISFEEAMKILGEDIPKEEDTVEIARHGMPKGRTREIENRIKEGITNDVLKKQQNLASIPSPIEFAETFFTPSQPTKMTQINTDLFERFIKGTKTQVLDSVERAEDSIEEREELTETIRTFYRDYENSKHYLERAYNNQDKQAIKKYLKEVQSKEDTLKDELFTRQLFPVIKSINKMLEKKSK